MIFKHVCRPDCTRILRVNTVNAVNTVNTVSTVNTVNTVGAAVRAGVISVRFGGWG